MLNKKLVNRGKLCIGMLLCAIATLSSPVTSITTYASEIGDVAPYTHYKEWVYKIENDKLYKALLNHSTGLLETDWIYVCDWPPEE